MSEFAVCPSCHYATTGGSICWGCRVQTIADEDRRERECPTKHYRAGGGDAGLMAKIMAAQFAVEKRIANITKGSTKEEEL